MAIEKIGRDKNVVIILNGLDVSTSTSHSARLGGVGNKKYTFRDQRSLNKFFVIFSMCY